MLETTFETAEGAVTVIDCMAVRAEHPVLIRCVRGERGQVPMRMELVIRFDYGSIVPWVTRMDEGGIWAVAGPDTLLLAHPVALHDEDFTPRWPISPCPKGEQVPFMLTWHPSHERRAAARRSAEGASAKPKAGGGVVEAAATAQGRWREPCCAR